MDKKCFNCPNLIELYKEFRQLGKTPTEIIEIVKNRHNDELTKIFIHLSETLL